MNAVKRCLFLFVFFTLAACGGGGGGDSGPTTPPRTLQSITIGGLETNYVQGNQDQLSVTGNFSDGTNSAINSATWSSSDDSVLTVSSSGLLNAVAPGTATVTATAQGQTSTSGTITIAAPSLTGIQVSSAQTSIPVGVSTTLTATGSFDNGTSSAITDAVWTSSNEATATVSATGVVSPLAAGTTTITATRGGVSGTLALTITAAELQSINIQIDNMSIADGTTTQASATGTFSDNSTSSITALWRSSDEAVATVSAAGLITAQSVGTTQISAVSNAVESNAITLTVTAAVATGLDDIANVSFALGQTTTANATTLFSNDTSQAATGVTWSSSDTNVVSITTQSDTATLTANSVGTATITASAGGFSTNFTATVTAAVAESIAFNETSVDLPVNATATLSVTATMSDNSTMVVTDSATFGVEPNSRASVGAAQNGEIIVTALEQGAAVLTATFNGLTATSNITVNDATPTGLSFVSDQNFIVIVGQTQNVEVNVEYSDGSKFARNTDVTWSVSDNTIGSVSADGSSSAEVGASQAGSFTVTAQYLTFFASFNAIASTSQPTALTVTPPTLLLSDTTKRAQAQFTFADSSTADATRFVMWSIDDTSVATVSNASGSEGLITPAANGQTTINASFDGGALTDSQGLEVLPLIAGFELFDNTASNSVTIGSGTQEMNIRFTANTDDTVTVQALDGGVIALASGETSFNGIADASSADFSNPTVNATQNSANSIVVVRNSSNVYAVVQVHEVIREVSGTSIAQVAFSWAIRTDSQSSFADYIVDDVVRILNCNSDQKCNARTLPRFTTVSQNVGSGGGSIPATYDLATYVLIGIGSDFTVANLSAVDSNGVATLSFDGIANGQVLTEGHGVTFDLVSTPTGGAEAAIRYFFDIQGMSNLTFTYTGTLVSD